MSIEFTMWRISPQAYRQAVTAGALGPERIAADEAVAKEWDVLARILAGGPVPVPVTGPARAIAGGTVLPEDDLVYGGIRVLAPELVREVAVELEAFGTEEVEQRYRTVDFTDCYGTDEGGAHASPVEDCLYAFGRLRSFYGETAGSGDAMAVWLG